MPLDLTRAITYLLAMPSSTTPQTPPGPASSQDAGGAGPRKTGLEVISGHMKMLPGSPGVYRMIDRAGDVIYVGKARSLKARVSSYARMGGHTNRIARMIAATAAMEFVTTRTESEALLLEANLIKRFRPRFNVLLRDDKSFPYILIARAHAAPQILKHRGARNRKGDYFGPFASAGAVTRAINTLQRAFLLRACSDAVYESRTRPCLLHQIKRCSAPCTGEIALADYARLVDEASRFLRGESHEVRKQLQTMMSEAADKLEFERAAALRNRLQAISHITADQTINPEGIEEADVFAAYQDGGQTCVQVFFFRASQNWGNRAYFPRADRSLAVEDVLASFIAQFYDDKPVPRLILLSHAVPERALLAEALSIKAQRRVEIAVPQRGAKTGLIEHALANAREALGRRLAESSSQRRLLDGIAERFGLAAAPRRIEVFDNSHIAGTNPVGAMIVAGPQGLVKNQYRKFNIRSQDLTPGDDYAMMREVLTRRFKRLQMAAATEQALSPLDAATGPEPDLVLPLGTDAAAEASGPRSRLQAPAPPLRAERGADAIAFGVLPAGQDGAFLAEDGEDLDADPVGGPFPSRPDLVLIDGGIGQLGVAQEVMAELGVHDICIIGIAKGPDRDAGREHFHIPGRDRPLMLEPRDPVLYFVQRLRDEAHRFAIGAHRARRSKSIGNNPLDEISGIGPTRRRALLKHFGSAKAVSRASVDDLEGVGGISGDMARRIYDFFHERQG